jgi:hypothetical protein
MTRCCFLLLLLLLAACVGTSDRLNRVSLGMTKAEVISVMGEPDSTAANASAEYLIYH